ncbi:hypothetical protein IMCC21906_01824 [Spongiibacter sp. IMCC21906]|jgi:antitoxin CptB|uniref:FAD assembly factor SdhE n=1 Tax=Spongiibacter sp. IMCC21906 TaxID=1620392 RepID=UPI00062DFA7C|nr:succinate dehydrogenase assembly factor 2 [Spongiibacter sp. IMCC21906]AKH69499.1 hypothetical protein IMCC21906_01824 [Spongiibacter sp. IMCC21906]
MLSESEFKRIRWACRRGMLELDLMMVPYVEDRFATLSEEDQHRFVRLLECEDTELFKWFLGKDSPEDPEHALIVNDIISYAKSK